MATTALAPCVAGLLLGRRTRSAFLHRPPPSRWAGKPPHPSLSPTELLLLPPASPAPRMPGPRYHPTWAGNPRVHSGPLHASHLCVCPIARSPVSSEGLASTHGWARPTERQNRDTGPQQGGRQLTESWQVGGVHQAPARASVGTWTRTRTSGASAPTGRRARDPGPPFQPHLHDPGQDVGMPSSSPTTVPSGGPQRNPIEHDF